MTNRDLKESEVCTDEIRRCSDSRSGAREASMGDGAVSNTSVTAQVFNVGNCHRGDRSSRAEQRFHQRESTTPTNLNCGAAVQRTARVSSHNPLRDSRQYLFGLWHAYWFVFVNGWLLAVNLGITFWILAEALGEGGTNSFSKRCLEYVFPTRSKLEVLLQSEPKSSPEEAQATMSMKATSTKTEMMVPAFTFGCDNNCNLVSNVLPLGAGT